MAEKTPDAPLHELETPEQGHSFAVTHDYAAEVDEIRELGRTLGGDTALPSPDPRAWREG